MVEIIAKSTGWPLKTDGPKVERIHPCNFCQSRNGLKVAVADYWDLAQVSYIRCEKCDLIQVDPMLSKEVVAKGCEAYYLREQKREGKRNILKNKIRSFRKGVFFANLLKRKGHSPKSILEVGPGDGYFSRGVQFIFPNAQVSCLDVVPEVLRQIEKTHGFQTLLGTPEELPSLLSGDRFDLVIARDIIEHVEKPLEVLKVFSDVLNPGGTLHIITPNGYEDIWTAYCHWKIKSLPGEMLINHVNFFPPKTLKERLQDLNFKPIVWFMYDFNGTRWGRARKISEDQMLPTSKRLSAEQTIHEIKSAMNSEESESKDSVLGQWWVRPRLRWITSLYCLFKEKRRFTLPADLGIGHEIFAILEKQR